LYCTIFLDNPGESRNSSGSNGRALLPFPLPLPLRLVRVFMARTVDLVHSRPFAAPRVFYIAQMTRRAIHTFASAPRMSAIA